MKREYGKRALLACMLLACAVTLSGCVDMLSERKMEDLSGNAIDAGVPAPVVDSAQDGQWLATLYFLSENGTMLRPVVRRIEAEGGVSRAQAAVSALLGGPAKGEKDVFWPDIGLSRSVRFMEVSGGVATVDLPARARTLPQETLYAVRAAITNTLTEFSEISYVNVLVGGREEGLDLGATLPVGTMTRMEDLDAGARYSRLHDQRLSDDGVTLLTTLYFPDRNGNMILPEVRSVAYSQVSPIEYLYTLLEELGKGASRAPGMQNLPAPLDYIEEMPEIVRTEDGYVAIRLRFNELLTDDLETCGLTLGVYMALLTDTLMGFVPGVEGLKVSIGEREVSGLLAEETPRGEEIAFDQTLAVRDDFAGFVGAPVTLYAMEETGGLARHSRVMEQSIVRHARERLTMLMNLTQEGYFALPDTLTREDILAVHMGAGEIVVNLSADFADALSGLTKEEERAAVYAMVNTLTEDTEASRVVFFFDGEQRQTLAGGLEMRGAFVRNPGMVVD